MSSGGSTNPSVLTRQHAVVQSLLAIADRTRGRIERDLAGYGITFQQFNVLQILSESGGEGLPTLEVAERLLERTPGITRLMDRLEGRGLIVRQRGSDRRRVLCSITAEGRSILETARPRVVQGEQTTVGSLNPNELGALGHFLNRIRINIGVD